MSVVALKCRQLVWILEVSKAYAALMLGMVAWATMQWEIFLAFKSFVHLREGPLFKSFNYSLSNLSSACLCVLKVQLSLGFKLNVSDLYIDESKDGANDDLRQAVDAVEEAHRFDVLIDQYEQTAVRLGAL